MDNEKIEHQFLKSEVFLPNWEIDTLVLGTFNPICGEKTDYFYGRCRNNFWRTLEEIHDLDYMWFHNVYGRKLDFMKINKFGCTDIIESILVQKYVNKKEFCGSGYSDKVIFTKKKCRVKYNFDEIKSFLINNKVTKVIHTWGKRNNPVEFRNHLSDFKTYCSKNYIEFIEECPSPSGRLRGKEHKEELIRFYKLHLTKSTQ